MDAINVFIVDAAGQWWVYPLLFVLCAVDGFFPPLPSESVVVALAAVAVSAGVPNVWLVVLVSALGAIAGDNIAYSLGRAIGNGRYAWMRGARVAAAFAWARHGLERRGAVLILAARYIPVGRVAVNMMAGASGYGRRRFVLFTVLAGISWAFYSTAIGTLAGRWVSDNHLLAVVVSVAIAMLLGLLVDHLLKLGGRMRRARLRRLVRARIQARRAHRRAAGHGTADRKSAGRRPSGTAAGDDSGEHGPAPMRAAAAGQPAGQPGREGCGGTGSAPAA
jgi:membrane protein DedA with SNARE-associated domain